MHQQSLNQLILNLKMRILNLSDHEVKVLVNMVPKDMVKRDKFRVVCPLQEIQT